MNNYPSPKQIDMGCVPIVTRMMTNGVRLNLDHFSNMSKRYHERLIIIQEEMDSLCGHHLNASSPDQVLQWMELNKVQDREGKKPISADTETIAPIAIDYPVLRLIMEYRKLHKLLGTYVDKFPKLVDVNGRLHTNYSVTGTDTYRLSSHSPNCFSGDTEILTYSGWVRFDNLKNYTGKIAEWCAGNIRFIDGWKYIENCTESLVYIHNQHIDLMVTPDHRCLLKYPVSGKYFITQASNYNKRAIQLNAGTTSITTDYEIDYSILRLIVAVQADGHYCREGNGIQFAFKKSRKIDRITKILKYLSGKYGDEFIKYRISVVGKKKVTQVYISGKSSIIDIIKSHLGIKKQFNSWILQLSRTQLTIFCNELLFWDGCWTTKSNYSSNDKLNADWVQIAFILNNCRTNVRIYQGSHNLNYQADITQRNYSRTDNISNEVIQTSCLVYCVSVPSTFIVVRRNGKVCITGQCQNVSKRTKEGLDVRRGFIPRDGYTFVKRDYSAQELRWLANLSGDSTMLNTYKTGGDLHLETEKAIFGTSDGSNRNPSKSINFGTVYGISGDGLWHQFLIMGVGQYSKFDCQNMLDRWFMKYPGVYYFMEDCRARAMRDGYVTDYFGYKCYVPEVRSYHKDIAERGLRQACNFLIQCPSAAQTKLAMRSWLDVIGEVPGWEPLLQIHDEFISEVPDDGIEEADSILRYVMNDAVTGLSLKFDSEGGAGANWADMIKLKG